MKEPIDLTSDNLLMYTLDFKPFRSMMQRRVTPFLPRAEEPQTMEVKTPWGAAFIINSLFKQNHI